MRIPWPALALTALALAGCGATSTGPLPGPSTPGSTAVPSTEAGSPPRDALAAQELWRSAEPERYRFTIRYSCFCPTSGRWRVDVENGVVTGTRPLDDQEHPGGEPNEYVSPIGELLADAARAESGEAGSIEATYDSATGVPTEVSIDWIINAIDDEIAWQITDFSPR